MQKPLYSWSKTKTYVQDGVTPGPLPVKVKERLCLCDFVLRGDSCITPPSGFRVYPGSDGLEAINHTPVKEDRVRHSMAWLSSCL